MTENTAGEKGQKKTDFNRDSFLNRGAIFSFDDKVWMFWGEPYFFDKRPEEPAYCPCSFFLENSLHWKSFDQHLFCSTKEALELLASRNQVEKNPIQWEEPSRASFTEQFQWIMESIENEKIQKAVPYVIERGKTKNEETPHLQQMLVHGLVIKKGYLYGHWENGKGRLGRTPEILIEQKSANRFQTMAVAGTTTIEAFNESPETFTNNEKENSEHDWVVKDIQDVLQPIGKVLTSDRTVEKTPHLVHLKTDIHLETEEETNIEVLVKSLHPTPALGVYPRGKSKEILSQLNLMSDRGDFGAPFGFSFNKSEALFVVAIRSVEWAGSELYVIAGSGIVKDSNLENEWNEIGNKRLSIKKMFGLV